MIQKLVRFLRQVNWGHTLGYLGLFLCFFIVFLYLTFPYDAVKNALVNQIEQSAPVRIEIEKLTPYRVTGLRAQNVRISSAEEPYDLLFRVDSARVRMHLLPLLAFTIRADVDLYSFGGGIAGQVVWKGSQIAMGGNFKDLDLARIGADKQLKKYGEIRITGKLDGNFETYFNNQERTRNRGKIRLEYRNLKIANSTILGNTFPEIVFKDPSVIQLSLTNRFFRIDEWSLTSDNLDIKATGRITLRDQIENSRFNLKFSVKPSEVVEDSFGMFGMLLPEADDEGYYNFTFSGTAKNPKFKKR